MELSKIIVIDFLKSHDFDYLPNQNKLCSKLERIYRRMALHKIFPPIKYADGKIVEGHHRYICNEMLSGNIDFVKGGSNFQETDFSWKTVFLEDVDWDTDSEREQFILEFD